MSDKESAQQKKKPGPTKLQLSWSASAAAPSRVSLSQGKSSRKRKRSTSSAKKPKKDESNSMWVDKYAPTNSADLCVAPKKVKEVKQWIEAAANASTSSNVARMLIWVGSPGVGKSTSIRILAKELGCTLHEWSDTYSTQYFENSSYYLQSVDQTNALGSFEEFLQRAGAGYTPLDGSSQPCKSVILIDELPNLHTLEAEERFR
jgi:cell cycle checkpoint protein